MKVQKVASVIVMFQKWMASSGKTIRGGNHPLREVKTDLKETRIIGGGPAPIDRYSYAVSLEDDMGHFCGGSLIAKDMVLTAAHCAIPVSKFNVVVGRYDLDTYVGDEISVQEQFIHPQYDSTTTNNDFNILFLSRPVKETVEVEVVTLNPDSSVPSGGDPVTVLGWGDTNPSVSITQLSDVLKDVEVNVVSNQDCQSSSGWVGFSYNSYSGAITSSMLCAKDVNEDSCQGDSGGPLVIRGDDSRGADDVQVGVVSWGVGCASLTFPGVYSRVSSAYAWIRETVCAKKSGPPPPSSFQCPGNIPVAAPEPTPSPVEEADASPVEEPESEVDGDTVPALPIGTSGTSWVDLLDEDFSSGYGLFNAGGTEVMHYNNILSRSGVVRIQDGSNGGSSIYSNKILLDTSYSKIRVVFSVYANGMEFTDRFCLDTMINESLIWEEGECYQGYFDFANNVWYDDAEVEFEVVSTIQSLRIRFRCDANSVDDDVLFDRIKVQGLA